MTVTVALAHATGFCGEVWRPVSSSISGATPVLGWDFPGHGFGPTLERPVDWWDFATFVLDQVRDAESPLLGVGHSMGATALLMAEITAPGTFAELLLIEPIVFPPPFGRFDSPMSEIAEKRRNRFASRDEARSNFVSKFPFSSWDPKALDGYLECALLEANGGFELACRPEDEAEIYRTATAHGAWSRLGEVQVPVTLMAGEKSNTHGRDVLETLAGLIPQCGYEIVPDASHFLPMEQPDRVAARVGRIASRLGQSSGNNNPG